MFFVFIILFFNLLFSQTNYCPTDNIVMTRSFYSIGDTLSYQDQSLQIPVCNGEGNYSTGDSFSFLDLNGNENGGDYKISIISMNATW